MTEVPWRCAGHLGKWYNMRSIDMSGKLPMCRRTENAQVRYSAAYPTGRELGAAGDENYCSNLLTLFTC